MSENYKEEFKILFEESFGESIENSKFPGIVIDTLQHFYLKGRLDQALENREQTKKIFST